MASQKEDMQLNEKNQRCTRDMKFLKPLKVFQLEENYNNDPMSIIDKQTRFYGWLRRLRIGNKGKIVFIDLYDGSTIGSLKCLASEDSYLQMANDDYSKEYDSNNIKKYELLDFNQLKESKYLSDGCSVVVDGVILQSPNGATQKFELEIRSLRIIGKINDPLCYPIQKSSEKSMVTLRKMPLMRVRSPIMQSIFRISSKLEYAIHDYMNVMNVTKVDPNILTISDCEGAGEVFTVSPNIFDNESQSNIHNETESPNIGLTVSSQLPLEAFITGFGSVYTMQKSFRAEKSDTTKHLSEFLHVEYESSFITFDELMTFTEEYLKHIISYVYKNCEKEFDFIESNLSPEDINPSRSLIKKLIVKPFVKVKHSEAIKLINELVKTKYELPKINENKESQKNELSKTKMERIKLNKLPKEGEDLSSEHEKLLVRYFGWINLTEEEKKYVIETGEEYGAFVFVTHWPLKIKSFYMKQCDAIDDDDNIECESFDLLAPRVGELFGGSMREWHHDNLEKEIKKRNMNIDPIKWYVQLREYGSVPHGGWGMGFARLVMLLTGVPSVRDVVPLPVYYGNCPY
jgi:asparaginyl-tRNA synthetase